MNKLRRFAKHSITDKWSVTRAFPTATLNAIEAAIKRAEQGHNGQICFALEASIDAQLLWRGVSARQRAIDVFAMQRVWDTHLNNGLLIYLLLADRDVEIVADRGIAAKVPQSQWEAICHDMEKMFREKKFEKGVITGIEEVAVLLRAHFPHPRGNANEISDKPIIL
ncbi:MAG: TPM domain-containing protein [Burkholderiales bacterium]